MPYLVEAQREELERHGGLNDLINYTNSMSLKNLVGTINYVVFKIVKQWLKNDLGLTSKRKNYFALCAILGTVICCALELYRRVVAPYEDDKIVENGEVE